jgi:hypothetical protein
MMGCFVAASVALPAQNDNVFAESFEGMFDVEAPTWVPEGVNNNPPPPVPLDGGLVVLLAAGSAAGFRALRKK